jgi:hypothetical protein
MHITLRFILASLLVPAVVLLGETASLAQYPPSAPPPGYGPPPGQPMPAYSPTPYQPMPIAYPGYHEHDGFYLRLTMGLGYLNTSVPMSEDRGTLYGVAGSFAAAFGGTIAPNLIIYGEISGMSATDPEFSYRGTSITQKDLTFSMITFGPGLAYYLQPANVYFSGSVGFGYFVFENNDDYDWNSNRNETDLGFGFSTTMGKEWWVTADWGLGVAAQFQMATAKSYDNRFTGYGLALMLSATYN